MNTTNAARTSRNRLPLAIVAGLVVLSGTMLLGGAAEARRGRGADDAVRTSTTVASIPSSSTPSIPSSAPATVATSRSLAVITVTTVDDHGVDAPGTDDNGGRGRGRGRGGRS